MAKWKRNKEIVERYTNEHITVRKLGEEYGVSGARIAYIIKRYYKNHSTALVYELKDKYNMSDVDVKRLFICINKVKKGGE